MDPANPAATGPRLLRASGPVSGGVRVPASKSLTNRALVAAALAGGGEIEHPLDCEDTRLLAEALAACGWAISWEDDQVTVGCRIQRETPATVFLGNSGTGARFLLAVAAVTPGEVTVDGTPRLRERPMAPLVDALRSLGAELEAGPADGLPVRVRGSRLAGGKLTLAPGISSQFVSALLLAAPATEGGIELELVGEIPSRPYLDLTQAVLQAFGATVERSADSRRWRVAGGGFRPCRYSVEGDWSAAAFPLAAAAVAGGTVEVGGVRLESAQGDRKVTEMLVHAGCEVKVTGDGVRVSGPARRPFEADLGDVPDLFPALAVVAASVPAGSRLYGLEALRHKESDRLAVMVANLSRAGAQVRSDGSSFRVVRPLGSASHGAIPVTAAADHRIAMAMAVAALRAGPLELDDPSCVAKSYPGFWEHWERLVG